MEQFGLLSLVEAISNGRSCLVHLGVCGYMTKPKDKPQQYNQNACTSQQHQGDSKLSFNIQSTTTRYYNLYLALSGLKIDQVFSVDQYCMWLKRLFTKKIDSNENEIGRQCTIQFQSKRMKPARVESVLLGLFYHQKKYQYQVHFHNNNILAYLLMQSLSIGCDHMRRN